MSGWVELAADDLSALLEREREADEWRAVESVEIDESDFVPEILPEDISEAFEIITCGSPLERAVVQLCHEVEKT